MSCIRTWFASVWLASVTLATRDLQCNRSDSWCASKGIALLQTSRESSNKTSIASEVLSGKMTMWSDSPSTIVGGSCEYANSAIGGLSAPSATSPYVATRAYCAADSALYEAGAACGACFRVTYDGRPATDPGQAGSLVVQIVDSGSAETFDCQVDAFKAITGATTGIFPVTYEPVACETEGAAVVTVLDGDNAWYTKVIFSNLPGAVIDAKINVGSKSFPMKRVSGATWSASPEGAEGAAGFMVTLKDGSVVNVSPCFGSWPVPTGSSCESSEGTPAPVTTPAAPSTPSPRPVPGPAPSPAPIASTQAPVTTPAATAPPTLSPRPVPTPAPTPAPIATTPAPSGSPNPRTCVDLCELSPSSSGTCSSHTDELACTSHYFQSGPLAMPCSWTDCGECLADADRLLECPGLESQCASECRQFCGKVDVASKGQSCGDLSHDESQCLRSFVSKEGVSMPCKWTDCSCYADGEALLECARLDSICPS